MKTKLQSLTVYLFMILLSFTFSLSVNAQINYAEGFNTNPFPPAGWTLTASGNPIWSRVMNGTFPTTAPLNGMGMARFASHNAPAGSTQTLITPVIDYSSITAADTARFSLWVYRDTAVAATGDSLTIHVNTIASLAGATRLGGIARSTQINLPVTVGGLGWYRYTFDIPNTFNTAVNYILVQGTSQFGNNIFVDDVAWTAYPPLCSGVPTGGVIAANPGLLCGGGGTATLTVSGTFIGLAGISLQWQNAVSSTGPWTNFGGNNATVNSTIAATTYYRCVVSCSYSGMADSSLLDSVIVSTSPLPIVIGTPVQANYCDSSATPVLLTASGTLTYAWSPAAGLNTTSGDSVYATPTVNTIYILTGYDSLGCSDTAHVNVQVRQPPNVNMNTPNDSVCAGDSTNITAQSFGPGLTYSWLPGGQTTATIAVAPSTTTTYYVTVSNNFGCLTTDSITIYIIPNPVANFSYTVNGRTVTFSDNSTNAISWYWTFGDGNLSFTQNPVYTYTSDSTYTVTLIVTGNLCGNDTITLQITINTLGIEETFSDNSLLIYPNPFSTSAQLDFSLIKTEHVTIKLFDMLGRQLQTIADDKFDSGMYTFTINRRLLESGTYVVKITTDNFSAVKRIIAE